MFEILLIGILGFTLGVIAGSVGLAYWSMRKAEDEGDDMWFFHDGGQK